eukprot:2927440-Amphidinium_carterae.1
MAGSTVPYSQIVSSVCIVQKFPACVHCPMGVMSLVVIGRKLSLLASAAPQNARGHKTRGVVMHTEKFAWPFEAFEILASDLKSVRTSQLKVLPCRFSSSRTMRYIKRVL